MQERANEEIHHREGYSEGGDPGTGTTEAGGMHVESGAAAAGAGYSVARIVRSGGQDVLRLPGEGRSDHPQACRDQRLSVDKNHGNQQDHLSVHGGLIQRGEQSLASLASRASIHIKPLCRASFRASMAAPREPAVSPFGMT